MKQGFFSFQRIALTSVFSSILFSMQALAQVPTPPPMRPEMTEFWDPEVPVVTPGTPANTLVTPPSDAIILFDGKDLSKWKGSDGGPAKWEVKNGVFTVKKGTGDITTTQNF